MEALSPKNKNIYKSSSFQSLFILPLFIFSCRKTVSKPTSAETWETLILLIIRRGAAPFRLASPFCLGPFFIFSYFFIADLITKFNISAGIEHLAFESGYEVTFFARDNFQNKTKNTHRIQRIAYLLYVFI